MKKENINKLYKIPNFKGYDLSSYRITKDGRLFGLKYNMFLKYQRGITGYYYYNLNINKKHVHVPMHRILCATFKPIPGWEKMVVDHIDGNRLNNSLDNIEFVTQKENSRRFRRGNYNYMQSEVAINYVKENKIIICPNIKSAAEQLGVPARDVMKRIHVFKEGYIFPDYTQIKINDNKPFVKYKDYDYQILKQKKYPGVKLYNHLTGESIEFDKILDASKYIKLSPSALSFRLNASGFKKVAPNGWEIKYKPDKTSWYSLSEKERSRLEQSNVTATPLKVTNIITGKVLKFNSIAEAAKYFKCTSTKIWYRLQVNRDKQSRDCYVYEYL